MKKTMKTMLALMAGALTFSACSSDELADNESANKGAKLVTLTACQEGDGATRATIDGTTSTQINWNQADKISYFGAGTTAESMSLSSGAGTATGSFTGTVTPGSTDYVLYPYQESATCANGVITAEVPMTQYAVENSFDPEAALMVAKVTSGTVQFRNVMSFVKVTIPEACTKCKQVVLKARDAWTTVAGKVNITVSDAPTWAETTAKEGQAFVRLVPHQGKDYLAAGESYYIAILPQAMATGFELIFNDDDNIKVKQSASASVEFTRNKTKKIAAFTDFTYTVATTVLTNPSGATYTTLKMADRNIGAAGTTGTDAYGDYFAWGALRPMYITHTAGSNLTDPELYKTGGFSWINAPYYTGNGSTHSWSKYNSTDGKTQLDATDDIAAMLWGGNWRMPTKAELEANRSNITVERPYAGIYDEKTLNWSGNGNATCYFLSSNFSDYNNADFKNISSLHIAYDGSVIRSVGTDPRDCGQSVRPVLAK